MPVEVVQNTQIAASAPDPATSLKLRMVVFERVTLAREHAGRTELL